MRQGVKSISILPLRAVSFSKVGRHSKAWATAAVSIMMLMVLGHLPIGSVAASEPGELMEMNPVVTPYWIKCPSGEAVIDGILTPAPLTSRDVTSEVDVTGPTLPRILINNIGTYRLELKDWYWDYHRLEVHDIEVASIWAKAREDVKDAEFRVNLQVNGQEIYNMVTEVHDLDGTPKEFKVVDPPSISGSLLLDSYDVLEVQLQYTAAPRTVGGPAPDCVFLAGSLSYPSRIELSVIPMNIEVNPSYANSEKVWIGGEVKDSSTLDPEEQLDYGLRIFDPKGIEVNPVIIEFSSIYVSHSDISVTWYWFYNLRNNIDGTYVFQMDVSYGVKGVSYSNTTEVELYFDEEGGIHGDIDGDGYPDHIDEFPWDPDEWEDTDGDGVGDNGDEFPHDANETRDTDGDRVGDNSDEFPLDPTEWTDTDGDGYGNNCDEFPYNETEWKDTDADGYGDNCDCFPVDSTEWVDSDGDGVGDNGDAYPNDPTEWLDTDGDGHGDKDDLFPTDPLEWADTDGDGHGDNGDEFPDDVTEWRDSDGDGHGDNSDVFPNDGEDWMDSDGDGHGDNGDAFPDDVTEWADTDGDGMGDGSDDFPSDPAASLDTDGDDHPDRWNSGMTVDDSTTGLVLDHYPEDSTRWEEETGPLGGVDTPIDKTTLLIFIAIIVLVVILVVTMRGKGDRD